TSCSGLMSLPPRSSTTVVRMVGTPKILAVFASATTLFTIIVGSWLCRLTNSKCCWSISTSTDSCGVSRAIRPVMGALDWVIGFHSGRVGVRLFQRSTRKLTLTEAGERFLLAIRSNLEELQASIASVATDRGEAAGVLKVSMGLTFGVDYIMPLLPTFLARYPGVRPDWQ